MPFGYLKRPNSGFIPTKEYDRREPNDNWLRLVNDNENDNYDGKAAYTHTHDNRATSQTHALIESMHPYAV